MLGPETIEATTMGIPRTYRRMRSVDVTGCTKDSEDIDAVLGQIALEVEVALAMPLNIGKPWTSLTLASITPQGDTSTEQRTGQWQMRFEAEYYTREGAPDVAA